MAASGSNADPQPPPPTTGLTIDKKANQVVFAEASKDVVDILLKFPLMPLGHAISPLGVPPNYLADNMASSFNNLYQSIRNLDGIYFDKETNGVRLSSRMRSMSLTFLAFFPPCQPFMHVALIARGT